MLFKPVKYNPISKVVKATKESSKQACLEKFLNDNYNLHINTLDGKFYQKKGNNMQEVNELNILRECRLMEITTSKQRIVETLLADNFCKRYNPIDFYFKHLPEWQGEHDHIVELANMVKLVNEKADRERFNRHFRKMLIRSVATGLEKDINKNALVLIGGQNVGKTSFCKELCPAPLVNYRHIIMPNDTIDEGTIALKFWGIMDEMAKFSPGQLNANKATMTKDFVEFRFFEKYKQQLRRHCNFIATTNYTEIFNDETGNSRFIPFELKAIDWDAFNNSPDIINLCWAQAFKMFLMIEKKAISYNYLLDNAEIEENDRVSLRYSVSTPAISWALQCFEIPDDKNEANAELLNASAIRKYYEAQPEFKYEDRAKFTDEKIGKAMSILKFPKGQERIGTKKIPVKGYYIIKKEK